MTPLARLRRLAAGTFGARALTIVAALDAVAVSWAVAFLLTADVRPDVAILAALGLVTGIVFVVPLQLAALVLVDGARRRRPFVPRRAVGRPATRPVRPWQVPRPAIGAVGPRLRTAALLVTAGVVVAGVTVVGVGVWRARQAALESRERLALLRRDALPEPTMAPVAAARPSEATPAEAAGPSDAAAKPAAPPPAAAVRQACVQAGALERDLRPVSDLAGAAAPAAQLIGQIPRVGETATAMLTLGQAAGEISAALRQACDALEPALASTAGGSDVASLVRALGDARGPVREATARLRAAHAQLAGVDERTLDETTRKLVVDVRDRLPLASSRLTLLAEVPGLLGYDGPRSFLLLGQNSDELRPTGGFIGTSGLLTFEEGRLVRQEYGSSFYLNIPADRLVPPPAPLRRFMSAGYWQLLESNWWPDYPSSARQADFFHDQVRPDDLAGVVAIDQDLIALLLGVTGPIEVPGYDEVVTSENVRDRLEYQVHVIGGGPEDVRKGFVSALFGQLVERLNKLPSERLGELTAALMRGLDRQHALVWVEDERAQQTLAELGWDGQMLPTSGDYLFPVSANLSANKVNREVQQTVTYEVQAEPSGRLVGRASIWLKNAKSNPDPWPWRTADYRDFLRVYAPEGSELLSANGFDAPAETMLECGRTAFAGFLVLPPGADRRVELTYRLPPTITRAGYSLVVQKQPGVAPFPIWVRGGDGFAGNVEAWMDRHLAFEVGEAAPDANAQLAQAPRLPLERRVTAACTVHNEAPKPLPPPSRFEIPRLGVRADTVHLAVEPDGTLEAPATGNVIGWYRQSTRPGQVGNMIVSGHLDWDKRPAVFWRLREMRPGDRVAVIAEGGERYEYEVEWVRSFEAYNAPLQEILGPTTRRWLTMITCGGTFNPRTRDYSQRTVVRAKLVGSAEDPTVPLS